MVAIFTRLRHSHEPPAAVDASDAILVSRALREREAFAALYLRYLDEMSRFCFLRLQDEDAARDATQQIFAQALAGLAHYRESGQFRAWLPTPSLVMSWQPGAPPARDFLSMRRRKR